MARKPMRSKSPKGATKGMRAVSTSLARPVEPKDDGALPGVANPVAPVATGTGGVRAASRKVRPYQGRKGVPTARMAVASPPAISRDQEYGFIREDLRRLLMTAGILIVVMIGLLLVIDR